MTKKAVVESVSNKITFKNQDVALKDLLLDPNNYRFIDNPTYKPKIKTKYHIESVQEGTLHALEQDKTYQLEELKKSIRTNGYVPMERIIIVPYKYKKGKFLVVEGNRRVAALSSLLREHKDGVISLTDTEVSSFTKIPCAILQSGDKSLQHAQRVIMGIRHIAGPREWGAYQQAQLITELYDTEKNDFQGIGDHLGISTVEVARRYRAMKALQFMEKDELYAEKAEPTFYRLFHELVSLPTVRERFGWDSNNETFTDLIKAREFFELIAPSETGEDGKLSTYSDVRKLKIIVGHKKAEASLLDPEQPFSEAIKIAELDKGQEDDISSLLEDIEKSLSKIGTPAIKNLNVAQIGLIDKLISLLTDIKKSHNSLTHK